MASACLVDANILVYTVDEEEPEKLERCLGLVNDLSFQRLGVLTTQILGEFFNGVTRRIRHPLTHEQARVQLAAYAGVFPVFDITLPIVLEATRGVTEHQMSYWDAQVWATAKLNQIPYLLTENMQGREWLEGVRFVDPLAQDFDLFALTGPR
jgi:predicted nucleic acid-binding protein